MDSRFFQLYLDLDSALEKMNPDSDSRKKVIYSDSDSRVRGWIWIQIRDARNHLSTGWARLPVIPVIPLFWPKPSVFLGLYSFILRKASCNSCNFLYFRGNLLHLIQLILLIDYPVIPRNPSVFLQHDSCYSCIFGTKTACPPCITCMLSV